MSFVASFFKDVTKDMFSMGTGLSALCVCAGIGLVLFGVGKMLTGTADVIKAAKKRGINGEDEEVEGDVFEEIQLPSKQTEEVVVCDSQEIIEQVSDNQVSDENDSSEVDSGESKSDESEETNNAPFAEDQTQPELVEQTEVQNLEEAETQPELIQQTENLEEAETSPELVEQTEVQNLEETETSPELVEQTELIKEEQEQNLQTE